jgi:hypothetical protein
VPSRVVRWGGREDGDMRTKMTMIMLIVAMTLANGSLAG